MSRSTLIVNVNEFSGIGKILLCDCSNVFNADLGRMFFRPENVGCSRMAETENMLYGINNEVSVEQLNFNLYEAQECEQFRHTIISQQVQTVPATQKQTNSVNKTLKVVFLCVEDPCIDSYINNLCLELDIALVHVRMGAEGLSGSITTVVRGCSPCLMVPYNILVCDKKN